MSSDSKPNSCKHSIYPWISEKARSPFALYWLNCMSFAESVFFPLPPDLLLAPMVAYRREEIIKIVSYCTIFSVAGGIVGYMIGLWGYEMFGQSIIRTYGYTQQVDTIRNYYEQYGLIFLIIASLTPVPYKLVTILSGVMSFNIVLFIIVSLIARGIRFWLVASTVVLIKHISTCYTPWKLIKKYAHRLNGGYASISNARRYSYILSLVTSITTITLFYTMEYIFHIIPCYLCTIERIFYFNGIAVPLLAILVNKFIKHNRIHHMAVFLLAVNFLASTAVSIYHSGVEKNWWDGLSSCASPLIQNDISTEEYLEIIINTAAIPSCDQVSWQYLGITLANLNAIFSLLLSFLFYKAFVFISNRLKQDRKSMQTKGFSR